MSGRSDAEQGFLLACNPDAGSASERVDDVREALAAHGPVEVRLARTARALDHAIGELRGRVLVLLGGDGSLHHAVQRLWDLERLGETTIALIPGGTGNDFARALALPEEPAAAAVSLARGAVRPVDLLVDDACGIVVNAVHAGLGAEAAPISATLKEAVGGLAYPIGGAIAAVREGGWRLDVTVDGEPLRPQEGEAVLMVAVGNGGWVGGGTPIVPGAVPDDGLLDVVVATAVGPLARIAFGRALATGSHLERDDVAHARGREVVIEGDAVRYDADGEVSEPVQRRAYRVAPAALRLLRPVGPGGPGSS